MKNNTPGSFGVLKSMEKVLSFSSMEKFGKILFWSRGMEKRK